MPTERRKGFRIEWGNSPGNIQFEDGRLPRKCLVSNVSSGGAKIAGLKASALPDEFELTITADVTQTFKCRVRWRADNELGVRFFDSPNLQTIIEDGDIPE